MAAARPYDASPAFAADLSVKGWIGTALLSWTVVLAAVLADGDRTAPAGRVLSVAGGTAIVALLALLVTGRAFKRWIAYLRDTGGAAEGAAKARLFVMAMFVVSVFLGGGLLFLALEKF